MVIANINIIILKKGIKIDHLDIESFFRKVKILKFSLIIFLNIILTNNILFLKIKIQKI